MNTLIATTTVSLLILSGSATPPLLAPPITQDKVKTSQGFVLKAGDQVVVEGNERLFPMMPVIPMKPQPTAERPGGDSS